MKIKKPHVIRALGWPETTIFLNIEITGPKKIIMINQIKEAQYIYVCCQQESIFCLLD